MNLTKKEERMVWMYVKFLESEADLMCTEVSSLIKNLQPIISKHSGLGTISQDTLTDEEACPLALTLMKIKNRLVKLRAYIGDVDSRLEI